jgi:hypothetical protein
MLMRKTILVILVDATHGLSNYERSFTLVVYLSAEAFLDAFINPYAESWEFVFQIRTM